MGITRYGFWIVDEAADPSSEWNLEFDHYHVMVFASNSLEAARIAAATRKQWGDDLPHAWACVPMKVPKAFGFVDSISPERHDQGDNFRDLWDWNAREEVRL